VPNSVKGFRNVEEHFINYLNKIETGGSGGPFINGWIIGLFPFLTCNDNMIENWHESTDGSNRFEFSLNKVPIKWECGREIDMHYYGGMIGVSIASGSAPCR